MRDRWSLFRGLLGPWTRQAAQRIIVGRPRSFDRASGRFTRSDVDRIVSRAWVTFADLSVDLPGQPTPGFRLNVRLGCLTLAFFRALMEYGVARTYAIELTADLTWNFYRKWRALRRFLKRGDPLGNFKSLSLGDVVPLSFPFNPPGYMARWSPTPEAPISFDMVRCPVPELFRRHNSADVCVGSWCNLDYPLGEAVGLKLTWDRTLAEGDDRCTFRWTPVRTSR